MADVKPIPEGANTVSTYLIVKDGQQALDFYAKAFGAYGATCLPGPGGQGVLHAEFRIGNSTVMLTEENEQWGMKSAESFGGSPASLHLYVDDVDSAFQTAVDAGCTPVAPVMDMFWGDRYGKVADPFGYQWGIATHVEDVPEEELIQRGQAWLEQMAAGGGGGG